MKPEKFVGSDGYFSEGLQAVSEILLRCISNGIPSTAYIMPRL